MRHSALSYLVVVRLGGRLGGEYALLTKAGVYLRICEVWHKKSLEHGLVKQWGMKRDVEISYTVNR